MRDDVLVARRWAPARTRAGTACCAPVSPRSPTASASGERSPRAGWTSSWSRSGSPRRAGSRRSAPSTRTRSRGSSRSSPRVRRRLRRLAARGRPVRSRRAAAGAHRPRRGAPPPRATVTGVARPPVRITSDPPRGRSRRAPSCSRPTPGQRPNGSPPRSARCAGSGGRPTSRTARARRCGGRGAARAFFLDDLDVLRLVTPRAAAFFSHGRAVATVQPDAAAHRTVVTAPSRGTCTRPRSAPGRAPARRRPSVDECLRPARRLSRRPAVAQAPLPRLLSTPNPVDARARLIFD